MDNLPHCSSAEIAKRLRELAKGLTDPEDIGAVHKYVDELEREGRLAAHTHQKVRLKADRRSG
jgi:hypothetical protein